MNYQLKALSVCCGLALLSAACAPVGSDSPIRLLGASALSGTASSCAASKDVESIDGSLDISASQQFWMAFNKQSDMQPLTTTVNSEVLAGPDRNDFIADQMIFTYSSTPALPFEPETQGVYGVIKAGEQSGTIKLNLLAPNAAQLLQAKLGRGDSVELVATFTLSGALASGQKLKSNTIAFPIQVFNSGFAGCPAGDIPAPTGPCGVPGGQDGSAVGCCSNAAFATACGVATTP